MTWAEFEEKEFEVAAAVELAHSATGYGPVFSSGQVLEKLLGYDATAAPPADHLIWQILAVPRPRGVTLISGYWQAGMRPPASKLPTAPISLVLQYKRPEYLYGARAKQWRLWYEPYLRFTIAARQQSVLLRLDRQLGSEALVRYAAPAFWRRGEFDAALLSRSVLTQTGFVSPERLSGHRVWTYVAPGQNGRANPGGKPTRFELLGELLGSRERARLQSTRGHELVVHEGLEGHVRRVAGAAREREPRLRRALDSWAADLREQVPELEPRRQARVVDLATITTVVGAYGASWYLV
ncbi:hypothetical protein DSM104299_04419 [Baekduia alba]|uniref:hypothetical protein n=1 Tax=Baekduia alba TaxID=2997333 RepID=UPI00233FAFD5|nr:hypothetical protein [Baekduia alba]WCB95670.1 hypothetical protein DSM104299_04419 [Baekduia alba]